MSKSSIIIAVALLLTAAAAEAAVTGRIISAETGEPLPGAWIKAAGSEISATSDGDGNFSLPTTSFGKITLVVSLIGYEVAVRTIESGAGPVTIRLVPRLLKGQDVVVTGNRAKTGETPIAFSNMSRSDIETRYWAQDVPVLLSSLPNVHAYSDAGSAIGYSYMKIRGFDQKRISVMLNGIPLNDAESHEVFWVDLPDFVSSLQDIQVQRGVGISNYGPSSIGGSVNLITHDFSAVPELKSELGFGSYNTRKITISGNSGLIKDSYVFYGRFSKLQTDGYRDKSWTRMFAYFLGIARYDENSTLKFNTYGGPEESHLAYKGIDKATLETNRKFNELQYDNEIDHFNQPHYELIYDRKIGQNLRLENTLYFFEGEGYYNQLRYGKDLAEYNLGAFYGADWTLYDSTGDHFPAFYYSIRDSLGNPLPDSTGFYPLAIYESDIVKRPTVDEYDWGWIPKLTLEKGRNVLSFGGEMRIHAGHHFGEIIWASIYPQNKQPNLRFYDYRTKSRTFSVFLQESFRLSPRLLLLGNIQYQFHRYVMEKDRRFGVTFERDFDYLSPRAGLNFRFNENISAYATVATASRHPALKDIYDPTDFWSSPAMRKDNFSPIPGGGWRYVGKELKPERLLDFEVGTQFVFRNGGLNCQGSVNLYRMEIRDELIPYAGQLDDMGLPVSGNAEKTLHQGIELSAQVKTGKFGLDGNICFNDDRFVNYVEYDYSGNAFDRSDKRIGGYPRMIGNLRGSAELRRIAAGIQGRFVGSQFIDNAEQYRLNSYFVVDCDLSADLPLPERYGKYILSLRINNIGDRKYAAAAYIEPDDGLPRYMAAAERNLYLSLKTAF